MKPSDYIDPTAPCPHGLIGETDNFHSRNYGKPLAACKAEALSTALALYLADLEIVAKESVFGIVGTSPTGVYARAFERLRKRWSA